MAPGVARASPSLKEQHIYLIFSFSKSKYWPRAWHLFPHHPATELLLKENPERHTKQTGLPHDFLNMFSPTRANVLIKIAASAAFLKKRAFTRAKTTQIDPIYTASAPLSQDPAATANAFFSRNLHFPLRLLNQSISSAPLHICPTKYHIIALRKCNWWEVFLPCLSHTEDGPYYLLHSH